MPDLHSTSPASPACPQANASSSPASEAPIGLLLDQGTMLVFGWLPSTPAATAVALLGEEPRCRGEWRCLSWASPAGGTSSVPFIAALALENIVRAQAMPIEIDAGQGSARLRLPQVARIELDMDSLLSHLQSAKADLSEVFDFLRQTLLSAPFAASSPRIRDFLFAFLSAISRQDGFIEILGVPEYGGLLIQGWSVHLRPGTLDVGIITENFDVKGLAVATFDRADLLETAKGIVGYAKDARIGDLEAVKAIHFKSGDSYFHLDVVNKHKIFLGGPESVAHLKDMLGKLQGDVPTIRAFKRVCRPRFPGHETASSLTAPVRVAQDLALHVTGTGIFVSGWLLDPKDLVMMVLVKSTVGFYARLDQRWVRLPRPDVTQGFAADPLFAGSMRPGDSFHGFMAFVPRERAASPNEQFYFEVVLKDETCGFLPLRFNDSDMGVVLHRLLSSVNIDDPAIERIVASHLGPIATALSSGRATPSAILERTPFGQSRGQPKISAIVPLGNARRDFDVNMACLSGDPDFREVELIVVAPRDGAESIAASLRRQAAFYELSGALILSQASLDYFEALELGVHEASADLMLFLAPSVFPRAKRWLSRLAADLEGAEKPGLISPTLLYEDDSIRFAGRKAPIEADLTAEVGRFAGYSYHWLDQHEMTSVWTGTAECCLLPRRLFLDVGGFSREFVGPDLKNVDFSMRLTQKGWRCYWTPHVTMYALDDNVGIPPEYWRRVGRLVDRWGFERKWASSFANIAANC